MIIKELTLNNFRRYERAGFRFHPRFTILIGENGKGKTTILDALAIMLGSYFIGSGLVAGVRAIAKSDKRMVAFRKGDLLFLEPQNDVFIETKALFDNTDITWKRLPSDKGGSAKTIIDIGSSARLAVSNGQDVDLPLFLYYGAGRLWETHKDSETEKPGSRLDAYRYCLDPKSDHKAFQKWFKKLTLVSRQKEKEYSVLNVIKKAVCNCVPEAEDFFFDIENDSIIVQFTDKTFCLFDNLSDGYRNMVAMVADIAHRAIRLNPHQGDAVSEKTKGVVLIDEIDLHLHPKWQRRVVNDLQDTFRGLQFIVTTHSPFIIQSAAFGEIIDLNQPESAIPLGETGAFPSPSGEFSNKPLEDIVEDIMGIPIPQRSLRAQQMFDAAKEYYTLLEQAKENRDTEAIDAVKRKLDELAAPFSDNIAYHAFLEMERIAAGFGSTVKNKE